MNRIAALCLLFAVAVRGRVPDVEIDYGKPVDEWWAGHPLNPKAANHAREIRSPEPVVNLRQYDGDLQRAIDSLPQAGGTIILPAGVWDGGFRIVGRKHVHLIGLDGAVIRGGENHVLGSASNLDYGKFTEAVFRREPEAMRVIRELSTRDVLFRNLTFDASPVRLASCRAVLFDRCVFRQPENRNVGDKDARGRKVLRWYRPLPVTGIMGLQGIWFRGCEFAGHHANAICLDGVQGSGLIDCRFAGVDRLWHNAVLLFTNDDLSLDVDGDGRLSPFERRDARYFVVEGCHFGRGYRRGAIAVSGRDVLVRDCEVEGPLESFLVVNAKTSGKEIRYESFGVKALNNTLHRVKHVVTAEGARNRPAKGLPEWWVWTKYDIGRFEIRDNRVSGMVSPLREIPNDSEILGPHVIEDNRPLPDERLPE